MVGVAISALVCLGTVVTLIQTLITTGNGDAVVGGEEPGLLLGAGVGLPDLGVHVVALGYSSVESEVASGYDD